MLNNELLIGDKKVDQVDGTWQELIQYIKIEITRALGFITLRPRQNGRHFADDIFKCIFLNENVWIPNKISLKCVPKGPINNIPSLVQIMVWRCPGAKPLSEPMMVSLLTHICVIRPQWVICRTKYFSIQSLLKRYITPFVSMPVSQCGEYMPWVNYIIK